MDIKVITFDLDNTLTDFMLAKENSINAAVDAMIDAGLPVSQQEATERIFAIYKDVGIEHQRVFNLCLEQTIGRVDDRSLAAAVVAYRRARGGSLVPYPHAKFVLNRLLKQGYKLAVVSDAPRFEAWLRLNYLGLQHTFDLPAIAGDCPVVLVRSADPVLVAEATLAGQTGVEMEAGQTLVIPGGARGSTASRGASVTVQPGETLSENPRPQTSSCNPAQASYSSSVSKGRIFRGSAMAPTSPSRVQ